MRSLELFLEIVTRYADLRWSEFRDDLTVKCMKALRKLRDGTDIKDLANQEKIVSGIEDSLELLNDFVKNSSPEEVSRVIDTLGIFTKAPAPCKMKIIAIVETLLGKRPAKG